MKRKNEEFIFVRNYNIVFEDMIDKFFMDKIYDKIIKNILIEKLKNNDDGKIIDYIFEYKLIIDIDNIFYIGDFKYYKFDFVVGKLFMYK